MTTAYRIKKAHRETVLNRQRRVAVGVILAVMLLVWVINCGIFTVTTEAAEENFIYISVKSGDTIWSIAGEYAPEQTDIRSFMHRISEENDINNYLIHEGQLLKIPQQ